MITEAEIKDIFFGIVSTSALAGEVSGRVYTDGRPSVTDGSGKEDIAISVNGNLYDTDRSTAFVYVNIYIKDKKRGKDLIVDQKRQRQIEQLSMNCLERGVSDRFRYRIAEQKTLPNESEHVIINKIKIINIK